MIKIVPRISFLPISFVIADLPSLYTQINFRYSRNDLTRLGLDFYITIFLVSAVNSMLSEGWVNICYLLVQRNVNGFLFSVYSSMFQTLRVVRVNFPGVLILHYIDDLKCFIKVTSW